MGASPLGLRSSCGRVVVVLFWARPARFPPDPRQPPKPDQSSWKVFPVGRTIAAPEEGGIVMAMEIGEFVTPSLRLSRRLGAGGMGTVWVARHVGLQSDVVVKFITGEHARNAEVVARFNREAAAAAEVKSPHVVHMLDHGVANNGLPFIAMELLEGEDFAARLTRLGAIPPAEVAGVVVQVCKALSRAHERNIVHRDIKPENIFLCETGEEEAFVKVLDFGIAKVTGPESMSGTATGAMLGTPYFMSPEQVLGAKSIDFRTDLWSLGVVAFFALTGTRPFDGETLGALSIAICHSEIPTPSSRNPQLPPAIDAWFARACARDPAQRFQSARAMSDALVQVVGGRGVVHVSSQSAPREGRAEPEAGSTVATLPGDDRDSGARPARPSTGSGPLASTTGGAANHAVTAAGAGTITVPPKKSLTALFAIVAVVLLLGGVGIWTATRSKETPSNAASAAAATSEPPVATEPPASPAPTSEVAQLASKPSAPSSPEPRPVIKPSTATPKVKAPSASAAPAKSSNPAKPKAIDEVIE
ncbi:MAG: protein kinase [Deltaproteobacteria bacterium]|nr:protein kinase [Deltaproteobacteria bacterium]